MMVYLHNVCRFTQSATKVLLNHVMVGHTERWSEERPASFIPVLGAKPAALVVRGVFFLLCRLGGCPHALWVLKLGCIETGPCLKAFFASFPSLEMPRLPERQTFGLKTIVDGEAAGGDEIVALAAAFCLRSLTMCTAVVHLLSGTPSGDDKRSVQGNDAAAHRHQPRPELKIFTIRCFTRRKWNTCTHAELQRRGSIKALSSALIDDSLQGLERQETKQNAAGLISHSLVFPFL